MKNILISLFMLFSFNIFAFENIQNYNVNIRVNENGSLNVKEEISYITNLVNKRGIIRYIPYKFDKASYIKLENITAIENIKASTTMKIFKNSNEYKLRLGDANIFLDANTVYKYNIEYTVYNTLRQKDNITQLYFNPIGNFWEMPIEKVNIYIENFTGDIEVATGLAGEKGQDYTLEKTEKAYIIKSTRVFNKNEGISFIINSKDFKYSFKNILINKYHSYTSLLYSTLIILTLVIINIIIAIFKYMQRYKKSIVVQYLPPDIDYLLVKKIDNSYSAYNDLFLVIISLVSKDFIYTITENKKTKYYINKDKINDINNLSHVEKYIYNKLSVNNRDIFKYNGFNDLLYYVNKYSYNLYKPYYNTYIPFILILIIVIFLNFIILTNFKSLDLSLSLLLAFISMAHAYSVKKYKDIYYKNYPLVKGFKKFLSLVESNKLKHFTDVDDIFTYFKKILPYALALNMENHYLKLVDAVVKSYNIPKNSINDLAFYNILLHRQYILNNITNNINRELASNKTNSSFGGGFSSGASSGGGFGGGGGSSW